MGGFVPGSPWEMAGIATLSPPAASTATGASGFVKVRAARAIGLENKISVEANAGFIGVKRSGRS